MSEDFLAAMAQSVPSANVGFLPLETVTLRWNFARYLDRFNQFQTGDGRPLIEQVVVYQVS